MSSLNSKMRAIPMSPEGPPKSVGRPLRRTSTQLGLTSTIAPMASRHGVAPPPRACRVRSLLLWLVFVSASVLPRADAVEVSFAHLFRHEYTRQSAPVDDDVLLTNTSVPSPAPTTKRATPSGKRSSNSSVQIVRRETTSASLTALVRWNTATIVPDFGMEKNARVEILIENVSYASFPEFFTMKQVPVVFSLYDIDQWRAYAMLRLRDMPLKSPTILCHYPAAMRYAITERTFSVLRNTSSSNLVRVTFDVKKASLYTLQVQVCGDASVYVAGRVKMVNRGFDNKHSEHLAVEELGLISLYKALIVIYAVFSLGWILEEFIFRKTVSKLAYIFQLALHMKTLEAFVKLWYYRELSIRGQRDTIFKTVKDFADSAASAVVLGVMLLAALGWSLTRDELVPRERRFMVVSFIFYTLIASMKATCVSDDDDICKAYMLTEYLIKSLMLLGVIVALNFTISQLRLALNEARWNNYLSPLMYMKLNQFQNFRYVFLAYLLVPTSLLVLSLTVVTPVGYWRYDWVNYLLEECTTLAIFAGIALNLRPIDAYIFSHISRGTDTRGPATRNTPPSPNLPPNGNLIVPDVDAANVQGTLTATEQVLESNRQLLREYGQSSPAPSPRSPPPPISPRPAPATLTPISFMISPMGRHPI